MSRTLGKAVAITVRLIFVPAVLVILVAAWCLYPPQPKRQWQVAGLWSVWLSPNGKSLIVLTTGSELAEVQLSCWDVSTGQYRGSLGKSIGIPRFTMCANQRLLAWTTGLGDSRRTRFWDMNTCQDRFGVDEGIFEAIDPDTILTDSLAWLDLSTGKTLPPSDKLELLFECGWRMQGMGLYHYDEYESESYRLALWDYHRESFVWSLRLPLTVRDGWSCCLEPSGQRFACVNGNNVEIRDRATGEKLAAIEKPTRVVVPFQFSHDGSQLLVYYRSTSPDFEFEMWDVATSVPRPLGSFAGPYDVYFTPGDKWLTSAERRIAWDTESFRPHLLVPRKEHLKDEWSSDGRLFVDVVERDRYPSWVPSWIPGSRDSNCFAHVMDIETGGTIAEIPIADAHLYAHYRDVGKRCYLLPPGAGLLTASRDGTIAVWDLPPRRPWWIEYGLPTLAIALVLGSCVRWLNRRRGRRRAPMAA
jgi:WD40 repeat protein